jgi:outer membrane protein assembly factor BamB
VDGDRLIVAPGAKDATLVALNKKTGDVIWKAKAPEGDGPGYASAIAIDCCGQRQYVQFTHKGVIGVAASDGKFLWRSDKGANGVANCAMPIFADDCVFTSSAYGAGDALVKLTADGKGGAKAEEVYATKKMQNHHGGVILYQGDLYGANGGNEGGNLVCLDFKTGEVKWDERNDKQHQVKKGATTLADGRLYYRQEDGTMTLSEPSPKEYIERGRFMQPERSHAKAWSYPVVANGKLYLRDQDLLFCYDVKEKAGASAR